MKRGLFGEKQNQVKIDNRGNAASCVLFCISTFDSHVNNGAVPFVFKRSVIICLYVHFTDVCGSTSCGQTSALNTRAVKETVAEVIIRVPEITAYHAKKENGRAYNMQKLFL